MFNCAGRFIQQWRRITGFGIDKGPLDCKEGKSSLFVEEVQKPSVATQQRQETLQEACCCCQFTQWQYFSYLIGVVKSDLIWGQMASPEALCRIVARVKDVIQGGKDEWLVIDIQCLLFVFFSFFSSFFFLFFYFSQHYYHDNMLVSYSTLLYQGTTSD